MKPTLHALDIQTTYAQNFLLHVSVSKRAINRESS